MSLPRWMALGLAGLLAAPALWAAAPPRPPEEAPGADVQEAVLLGQGRAVRLRFHVRVDGRPFAARWEALVGGIFDALDRDRDGHLTGDELTDAPHPAALEGLARGRLFFGGRFPALRRELLDRNEDGKVSRDEFLRYYRSTEGGPIRVNPPAFAGGFGATSAELSEALFRALDRDGDGKLDRAELAKAGELLDRFDQDDDELLVATEVVPVDPFNPRPRAPQPGLPAGRLSPLVLLDGAPGARRATDRLKVANDLLGLLDRNRNGKLEREELGLDEATFARLDANRDGGFDPLELLRWVGGPPDATVRVDLVSGAGDGRGANRAVASLKLPGARLSVVQAVAPPQPPRANLVTLFDRIDTGRTGEVTMEQVRRAPGAGVSPLLFLVADEDRNGRLTRAEFQRLLERGVAPVQVRLTFGEVGRGLFELLDANRDGRLSPRELRGAGRLAEEFGKGGAFGLADVPQQLQVGVVLGGDTFGRLTQPVPPAPVVRPGISPAAPVPARGPVWFRKMDRNGDGDVSRREFLGTGEDFRRIDADGDGLIGLEEAEKADAWFRERLKK